ncbi:variant erythrocyte surface antigen-1 family protein, partial [Babesia divergens]
KSCNLCSPSKFPDNAMTGLGICPMNPRKLAQKLEGFFGNGSSKSSVCSCTCGSPPSCCCLACPENQTSKQNCLKSCDAKCDPSKCSSHQSSQECPCKAFCIKIDGLKVPSNSDVMKCCNDGKKCHCQVDPSKCSGSPNCCDQKKKVKCLIRRLVSYFKSLQPSSVPSKQNFKNCCEFLCVLKTCEFLNNFLGGKDGQTFYNALKELRFAGPCGQELWRTLDSFLNFIRFVFYAKVKDLKLEDKIKTARDKCGTCNSKSGKHSSCNGCKSGTSCDGCTETLKKLEDHKDVLSLMTRGYSSAYSSEASWTSLTSSGSGKCCGSSSCTCPSSCSSPGSSCPSQCCPECPQRKAAKIFLGMLPCLYWGLKILYERCKYNSGFAGWNRGKIPEASGLKDFLSAWGFTSSHLKSKNASGLPPVLDSFSTPKVLEKLYNVSLEYFSMNVFTPDPSKPPPTTVRSMLLWLYGLRFQKHFSDIVENCKSLCLPFGNSFHPDDFCYYIHTTCFFAPLAIISLIEDSSSAQKVFSSSSEFSKFLYPSDPSELFEKLCEYARKIFVALNFLYFQCERVGSQAGWAYCWYGKNCIVKPLPSTSVPSSSGSGCSCPNSGAYLCTAINKDPVHDHCAQGKCRGFPGTCSDSNGSTPKVHPQSKGKTCTPCPHPLQAFLIDDFSESTSKDPQNFRTPFHSSTVPPMGFSQQNLPEKARWGQDLYYVLKSFCKDGFCPLTRLVQFILCISQRPPETLLGLYAFFKKFVEALNSKTDPLKDHFVQWIDGEPGRFLGNSLKDAVRGLYGSNSHSGDHSVANLFSLSGCHANKASGATCGAYLFPLTDNVAGVFTPELCGMYLSWICYRAKDFKTMFKDFHQKASEKFSSCCKSSCKKIVECPCALPFIYSNGFTFFSPGRLNCVDNVSGTQQHKNGRGWHNEGDSKCTTKSCQNFITQLKLVAEGQPFKDLLTVIDNFLWHIRLPFVYAFLYIWILVISYFYYVQFYKLDLLHIDSHLHLPRSFKILPSTLFSDASSKLKDLSYFTL